jgi:hypothetical protein
MLDRGKIIRSLELIFSAKLKFSAARSVVPTARMALTIVPRTEFSRVELPDGALLGLVPGLVPAWEEPRGLQGTRSGSPTIRS